VLDDALAGIAAIDHDLSAFVAIDADGARRAAVRPDPPRRLRAARALRGLCRQLSRAGTGLQESCCLSHLR